ncbi:MAG: tetratricopeptide repeat protein [Pyrinomonadaceae bacterium]
MKKITVLFTAIVFSVVSISCSNTVANNDGNENSVTNSNANLSTANSNEASDFSANEANTSNDTVPTYENAEEAFKSGEAYSDKDENDKAIEAYKQATELNPDFAEAHFKLGVAYALIESGDEPVSEDDSGKKKGKKETVTKKNSEIAFENAVKAYKKHLTKNPKDDVAYYNLGRAYNKLFEDNEAEKALQKAVDLKPDDSMYRTELGGVQVKLAKYPNAIKQLEKAVELDDQNYTAQDLLVEAKAGRKRTDFNKDKQGTKKSQE